MKERLQDLLKLEQLSPSRFADLIGVQRSSVSHIISGRNKPSFDFLQKTLKAFPGLSAEWLLMGKGNMYTQQEVMKELFQDGYQESGEVPSGQKLPDPAPVHHEVPSQSDMIAEKDPRKDPRRPVKILVLYDDNTFVSYEPGD